MGTPKAPGQRRELVRTQGLMKPPEGHCQGLGRQGLQIATVGCQAARTAGQARRHVGAAQQRIHQGLLRGLHASSDLARPASASSTSRSGTAVSHSIKVGTGPRRPMAWA
mmetsp:Transcript_5429/g.20692  ORF Transcript_5429/g.20692 Transcript_5429/m.20692 type:complete len:110 (-) Transcript_5429:696-1025(-)